MSRKLIAVVTVAVLGAAVALSTLRGGDDGNQVRARFESAAPLVTGNEVKLDGVVVGKIEQIAVRDGQAEVTMNLDEKAMPLHRDATFTIRPASLLGERYVALERGSQDQPMLDASKTVPVEQTASSVGLDEVVNTLDDPTGEGLAQLLSTLGNGVEGRGENVDEAIRSLSPSMAEVRDLAAVLENHNSLLNQLIENAEPLASAVAERDGKSLDQLVDSADRLLGATSEQQAELDRTIAELPETLESARQTLDQLSVTAEQTAPTLKALRPLTDKLPQFSKELENFADALDPALATSEPVLERGEELLKQAGRPAADLRKASPDLATSVDGAEPLVSALGQNTDDLFNFIRYWSLNTNGKDGLSHYWRVNLTLSSDTWTGLLGLLNPGGAAATEPAAEPSAKKNEVLDSGLLNLQESVSGLVGGTLLQPQKSKKGDGLTGLNQKQEKNLLEMLLGGGK